jgi:hypothetical protein
MSAGTPHHGRDRAGRTLRQLHRDPGESTAIATAVPPSGPARASAIGDIAGI